MNRISHKQAIRWVDRRLDGLLGANQRLVLDEHLRSCNSCRTYAAEMDSLSVRWQNEFHGRWDDKPGPSQKVIEQVTAKARKIPMINRISSGVRLFAGIAALVLMVFLVNFVVSQLRNTSISGTQTEPTNNETPISSLEGENRLLAFASDQNGNADIYTMRANGSGLTNLTNHPAYDANPIWSPDGKHIAFESDRTGFMQIYLMDADGSNIIQLTNDEADHNLPLNIDGKTNPWSPDGGKLLFLQDEAKDKTWALYSVDLNGENKSMLAKGRFSHNNLSWSPDGTYIGYILNESPTPDETFMPGIYIVHPDGSNLRAIKELIPQNESFNPPYYYWSRDGRSMFFVAHRHIDEGKNQWVAYEIRLASNELIEKAMSSTYMGDWWTGTSFIIGAGGESPFTWLRSDGTYSTFKPFESCKPPDGVQYIYRRSSNGILLIGAACPTGELWLYWANPDGTVIKLLLDLPISDLIGVFRDLAWSPDDQHIAFTIVSDKTSMYILNVEEALKDSSIQPKQVVISNGELFTIPSWQPAP